MSAATKQSRFLVEGMDCASCATKIDTAARRVPGVEDVSVSVTAGTMTVRHAQDSDLANLEKRVTSLGYKVSSLPASMNEAKTEHNENDVNHDHAGHNHSDHVGNPQKAC